MNISELIEPGLLKLYPKLIMGHKAAPYLLERILSLIPEGTGTLAEPFGGTGVVGWAAKRLGIRLLSNDVMRWALLRQKVLVANNGTCLSHAELTALAGPNRDRSTHASDHYTRFMGEGNTRFIDNWAANISTMEPGIKRDVAIFLPVVVVAKTTNGNSGCVNFSPLSCPTGNRTYFHVDFEQEVFRYGLDVLPRLLYDNGRANEVFNMDAVDFVCSVQADCGYYDPPYTTAGGCYEQKLAFFDDLVRILSGEGHLIRNPFDSSADLPEYSDFSRRSSAVSSLSRLFRRSRHLKTLIVSYNTTSGINEGELECLARAERWNVTMHRVSHRFPSTKKNGLKKTDELLMVCT